MEVDRRDIGRVDRLRVVAFNTEGFAASRLRIVASSRALEARKGCSPRASRERASSGPTSRPAASSADTGCMWTGSSSGSGSSRYSGTPGRPGEQPTDPLLHQGERVGLGAGRQVALRQFLEDRDEDGVLQELLARMLGDERFRVGLDRIGRLSIALRRPRSPRRSLCRPRQVRRVRPRGRPGIPGRESGLGRRLAAGIGSDDRPFLRVRPRHRDRRIARCDGAGRGRDGGLSGFQIPGVSGFQIERFGAFGIRNLCSGIVITSPRSFPQPNRRSPPVPRGRSSPRSDRTRRSRRSCRSGRGD